MAYIAKADYFAGVFLTTILKATKTVPMLCDDSKEAKCVSFDTDIGNFNVYVKYSTNPKEGWNYKRQSKIRRTYWYIPFTTDEYSYLCGNFEKEKMENLIAIVCSNEKFTSSKIAILTLEEVKKCLSKPTKNGSRRITVSRTGCEHTFDCFGVEESHDIAYIHPYVNHLRFFDRGAEDNE